MDPDSIIIEEFPPAHPCREEYERNVAKMEQIVGKKLSPTTRGVLAIAALTHFAFRSALSEQTPDADVEADTAFSMLLTGLFKYAAITESGAAPRTEAKRTGFGFDTTRVQREDN